MNDICIVGSSKTGTTGVYSSVRSALDRDGVMSYGMHEKYPVEMYRRLALYQPDRTVVSKMLLTNRHFSKRTASWFDKRILISRDPRDTLVSVLLYYPVLAVNQGASDAQINEFVELIRKKEEDPSALSFLDLLLAVYRLKGNDVGTETEFSRRFRLVVTYAEAVKSFLLSYEDFVRDELDPLSNYLGFEVHNRRPGDYNSIVFRTGSFGDWSSWFLPTDVEHFRPMLSPYMERFGYDDDWELQPEPRLDPTNGSEYVIKSTAKRRSQIKSGLKESDASAAETLDLLRSRADDGAANAAYRGAKLLRDSPELADDPSEIYDLALFSAACGELGSMKLLAECYSSGLGTEVDEAKARFWDREYRLEVERKRLATTQTEAEAKSQARELEQVYASARYRVGSAMVDAFSEPGRDTLRLPGALWRIAKEQRSSAS